MAKRMTDSEKWEKEWFQNLTPKMKLFWIYLCDETDAAGVWDENYRLASFKIGMDIAREDLAMLAEKFLRIEKTKIFIPSFVEFQYGELSPDCRPHVSVIKILKKHGICPDNLTLSVGLAKGTGTLKDKEQEKEQERDLGKGCGENQTRTDPVVQSVSESSVEACKRTWVGTLEHFKIFRSLNQSEEVEIARAIVKFKSAEYVDKALYGARFEKKTPDFDPADHVSIVRVIKSSKDGEERIHKFANLGSKAGPIAKEQQEDLDEQDKILIEFDAKRKAIKDGTYCGP